VQQQSLALYAAQVSLIRVRSEQLVQRVNLYLALGGSFDERPAGAQSGEPKPVAESGSPR
jgi:outer membrane protein TolC